MMPLPNQSCNPTPGEHGGDCGWLWSGVGALIRWPLMAPLRSIGFVTASMQLVTTASQGEVVSYEFAGRVKLVFGAPFYGITPAVDDPVNGRFRYESSIVGAQRDGVTYFDQPQSSQLGVTLRGLTIMSDRGYTISLLNNVGYDSIQMFDNDDRVDVGEFGTREGVIELCLTDWTETALGTQHVLPIKVDLSSFSGPDTFGEVNTVSFGLFSGVVFSIDSVTAVPEPAVSLSVEVRGGSVVVRWVLSGGEVELALYLERATDLDGSWQVLSNAVSPYVEPMGSESSAFFRIVAQADPPQANQASGGNTSSLDASHDQ